MTDKKGFVLIFVLVILVGLSLIAFTFLTMASYETRIIGAGLLNMRAFYIAEAGRAKARWRYTTDARAVGAMDESNISFGGGMYTYTTAYSDAPANQHVTITSTGYIPNSTSPIARRTVVQKKIQYYATGKNLSRGTYGTIATSSPYQGNNDPGEAIDGSTHTGWVSNVKATSWLALDYGSKKTVARVVVDGSKITSIVVQYSTDGINYFPVLNPVGALPGTRTFTRVPAKYIKLDITSDKNDKAQVDEFESYANATAVPTLDEGGFVTSQ